MRANAVAELLSEKHKYAAPALLAVLICITYYQITGHAFISYDDEAYITENAHVMNGLTYDGITWALTSLEISYWHPLTWISHMIDYQLYGGDPFGHHLTSLVLHIANTLLLFYLLYQTTKKYWPSLFVAALFALHPLHVESVAWAAERKDLLSTFFMMLTLIFYSSYVKHKSITVYGATIVFYLFGLMSKPMLISLPIVLMLWDCWPLDRYSNHDAGTASIFKEKLPFFIMAFAISIATYYAQLQVGAVSGIESAPFSLRIINGLSSYIGYIFKMFWPRNLAVIYPLPDTLPAIQGVVNGALLLGISALVYHYGKSHRYLTAGWAWYLITLLPVIGFVQAGPQSMADRYTYITQIGLYIMIAWGVADVLSNNRYKYSIGFAAGIMVISACTVCTWTQVTYWKNSITLFSHAVHATDNNYMAYRILGNNYAKNGDIPAAIESLSEAVKIRPNDPIAHVDLGVALEEQKRYDEAGYHFATAIAIDPNDDNAHYNLGVLLAYNKRYEEAIESYRRAVRINPGKKGAHANIGAALFHLGKFDEAIHSFQDELQIDPGNDATKSYLALAIAMKNASK
jgi:protein O-mannosyl-transferase